MSKILWIGIASVLSLLSMQTVRAEDSGVYLGAGIGLEFTSSTDSASMSNLFVGYSFNKYVSAELDYLKSGGQVTAPMSSSLFGYEAGDTTVEGFSVGVLGRAPFGTAWEFFGKLGYGTYDRETYFGTESHDAFSYGVGFSRTIGKSFALGLEVDFVSGIFRRLYNGPPARRVPVLTGFRTDWSC